MNYLTNRFLYSALALCLVLFSCDKEDDLPPAAEFVTTSEINAYGGDIVEVKVAHFDQDKYKIYLNSKEITDYTADVAGDQTTLSFAVPPKIGSGNITVSDGVTVTQGPKVNYQKQYVFNNLNGYILGWGMTGFKDDKMAAWNSLDEELYEIRLKEAVSGEFGVATTFGIKSTSIPIAGSNVTKVDRTLGIGKGPSGKIYFFQGISKSGTTESHLFATDLTTTTEYGGGIATGQFTWVTDIKVDSKENLFTVEYQLPVIKKVTTSGVSVFAGTTSATGHTDGTGAAARFTSITSLTVDSNDNLLVSDGNCVRLITPSGVVSTLTGTVEAGDRTGTLTEARYKRIIGITTDNTGKVYMLDSDNGKMKVMNAERTSVTAIKVAGDVPVKGDADFNSQMYVDSKQNIYYFVRSTGTNTYNLKVLIHEDNLSEDALAAAIDSPYNSFGELEEDN